VLAGRPDTDFPADVLANKVTLMARVQYLFYVYVVAVFMSVVGVPYFFAYSQWIQAVVVRCRWSRPPCLLPTNNIAPRVARGSEPQNQCAALVIWLGIMYLFRLRLFARRRRNQPDEGPPPDSYDLGHAGPARPVPCELVIRAADVSASVRAVKMPGPVLHTADGEPVAFTGVMLAIRDTTALSRSRNSR